MNKVSQVVVSACCILIVESAWADSADLDTLVVTGTRTERLSRESPVRTEVVSAEEIETIHARDLKEALQYLPGIQLREIHGKSGYEVWIQGMNADRVLILIDGMPVSPTTGSSVDVTQLSLVDVERVEVVKGATSALYGSAAMGGVVNVITRKIDKGLNASMVIDGGTYGEQNPDGRDRLGAAHSLLRLSVGSEQWRARLSWDENSSEGIDPDPITWAQPGDEYDRRTLDSRLEWHGAEDSISAYVQGLLFEEATEARSSSDLNADNVADNLTKTGELERQRISAGLKGNTSDGFRWSLDGLQEQLFEDTVKESAGVSFDFRSSEYNVARYAARIALPAWDTHQLLLGADVTPESLSQEKQNVFGEESLCELQDTPDNNGRCEQVDRYGIELYAQEDWFIRDDIELLLGARYQDDSDFGGHFSPKVNLRYQIVDDYSTDLFVRAGWGTGFRVPNLKERYFVFDHSNLGYVVLGNPALQPESSSSWQLGLGAQWEQNLLLDVNFFHNELDDLIQTDFDRFDNGIAYYRYLNVEKAKTYGVEITSGYLLAESIELNAGYTFLKTRNESQGTELTKRPRHQGSVGADWQALSTLKSSLRWRVQSDELLDSEDGTRSPGWGVLDLKINYDYAPGLKVFGGMDNLLNRQRDFTKPGQDFAPLAGRFLYVGLALSFAD